MIEIRRHNAGFCADCFLHHTREQVRRAVDEHRMIAPGERVLVVEDGGGSSCPPWSSWCACAELVPVPHDDTNSPPTSANRLSSLVVRLIPSSPRVSMSVLRPRLLRSAHPLALSW